jgi:hypothetical protein
VPTLGTNYMSIGQFGWRPTREVTTLKTGGKWRNGIKSWTCSLPVVQPLTYEHVATALVQNTVTTRMTPARVGIDILFVHQRANHFTVISRVK